MNALSRLWKRALTFRQSCQALRPLSSEPPQKNAPSQRNPITEVVLTDPLPGFAISAAPISGIPTPKVQDPNDVEYVTQVTELSNGLKVATLPNYGRFCTVGVVVNSGSRYEVAYPSGISHFLEKMAFGATEKFENKDDITRRLEKFGGICDCQSTRDTFLYAASVESRGLEQAIEILGDVVLRPKILEEEIEYSKMAIQYEIEDVNMRPDQEALLTELLHSAAFSNNTLGLPKLCPTENLNMIKRNTLIKYLSQYHTPNRMVVGGVGVDHDLLVDAVQKYFVDEKSTFLSSSGKPVRTDQSVAQYTGGLVTLQKDLSKASLGPTPMPNLAHCAIGLESVSHQHPDFIPMCVINVLMGGGGSFSAGGPGKGMYARLYLHVLNRYHWMYAATAYNHAYGDGGVFCINASGPPEKLDVLVEVISSELVNLARGVDDEEFERAKKQLTSMLLMNLETRPVMFEDLVRQVLAQGRRHDPEFYIEGIKAVTKKDIKRIAEKMLSSKPAVAAIGDLKRLPEYRDIELGLIDRGVSGITSRFNPFRR